MMVMPLAGFRRVLLASAVATIACGAGSSRSGPSGVVDLSTDAAPMLSAKTLAALAALSPPSLPQPRADISNVYADNAAAAALGQQLFFDPGFSGQLLDPDNNASNGSLGLVGQSGKVACASCHIPTSGFVDTRSIRQTVSLAAGWGKRKAPSLLDVGQAKLIMWDGRRDALYNQPFGALENGIEMNSSRLYAAEQIYSRYRSSYTAIFGAMPQLDQAPFPQLTGTTTGCSQLTEAGMGIFSGADCHGMPGDRAEFDSLSASDQDAVTRVWVNAGKALGAYERRLSCGPSRFDQWVHGQGAALTPSEQRGAALFVGQREDGSMVIGCNTCHSGPFMTDEGFHNVGLQPVGVGPAGSFVDANDQGALTGIAGALTDPLNVAGQFSDGNDGRLPAVVPQRDNGAFLTPSMRCVAMRPSFMHNGQIQALGDVVRFFSQGGNANSLLPPYPGKTEIAPLNLMAREITDLVAFLDALTGPGPDASLLQTPQLP